jgi:uncharacterized protein (TIGR02270 family)
MTTPNHSTVLPKIIDQHLVETAFLWTQRDRLACAPHIRLGQLDRFDDRVEAHIDGLRVAGCFGWGLARSGLEEGGPGELYAAAVLAFESDAEDRINLVLEKGPTAPPRNRAVVSALGWCELPTISKHLQAIVASSDSVLRWTGIAGYAVRRQDPGQQLVLLLKDEHPRIRARALKAAAELGRREFLPSALQALREKDDDCRFYAAWAAIRFAPRGTPAAQTLMEFVDKPTPRQREAVSMAVRGLDVAAAKAWLNKLGGDGKHLRLATIGAGALGDPELIETLINLMQIDDLARVAGESFSMITGVDLSEAKLERERPEGFESGPTDDPADENVAMDEDENLPWPNADLVAKWWSANRSRFQPGRRYLCGREISVESARQTLVDGKQRQRAAAAMELAMLQPHEPLFNVRARGSWQQQWLKTPTR